MATSTRHVGTCPVCDKRFKVRSGKLVHHGYQRPGWGHIVGDCFAVGHAPHETSPDTARAYGESLKAHRGELEQEKARVESAVELVFHYTKRTGCGHGARKEQVSVTLRAGDDSRHDGFCHIPSFADLKVRLLRGLGRTLEMVAAEIVRMERLVAGWTLQPLTTLEEETRRVTAEKAAAREAKKAERAALKAAKEQKRKARL